MTSWFHIFELQWDDGKGIPFAWRERNGKPALKEYSIVPRGIWYGVFRTYCVQERMRKGIASLSCVAVAVRGECRGIRPSSMYNTLLRVRE